MTLRIGHGYDIHRLEAGRRLFLGCIEIPFDRGLLGHSDGDVAAHALADAMLGAAGLGDLGQHFPESDPTTRGMSGKRLLEETSRKIQAAGFEFVHGDLTIVAEAPRLSPHRDAMIEAMLAAMPAALTPAGAGFLGLKARTNEGLDAVGEGRAIAAYAVVLLRGRGGAQ